MPYHNFNAVIQFNGQIQATAGQFILIYSSCHIAIGHTVKLILSMLFG